MLIVLTGLDAIPQEITQLGTGGIHAPSPSKPGSCADCRPHSLRVEVAAIEGLHVVLEGLRTNYRRIGQLSDPLLNQASEGLR